MLNCQVSTWESSKRPTSKHQRTTKLQASNRHNQVRVLSVWCLEFLWMLELGIWCLILFRQRDEVLQQLQADLLAFLRVELGGIHIVLPDGGSEVAAVIRARGDDARIRRLRIEAMDEIHVAAVRHVAIERAIRTCDLDLIPRDLRNLQPGLFGKAHDAAAKNAEACRATVEFLTALEQRLIADADAEKRFTSLDEIARGFEQFLFAES